MLNLVLKISLTILVVGENGIFFKKRLRLGKELYELLLRIISIVT